MNVVFDLGGVVFKWQPDDILRSVFDDVKTQDLVKAQIFDHNDWIELDRGTISFDRAVARGATRTGLSELEVQRLLDEVPQSLTPIPGTMELLQSVKESNNKMYVLSNMQFVSIAYLEEKHRIWDMFDGVVISCRINKVKPESEIYEHLLVEHQLQASETVFIDDMSQNLSAAASHGIQTIKFLDAAQCRQDLVRLGCL
jgi:putative hydrolase of the HAD superfamily